MDQYDKDLLTLGGGTAGGAAVVAAAEKMRRASLAAQKQKNLAARANVLVNGETPPAKAPLEFSTRGVAAPPPPTASLAPPNTIEVPAPSKGVVKPTVDVGGGTLPPTSAPAPTVEGIDYVPPSASDAGIKARARAFNSTPATTPVAEPAAVPAGATTARYVPGKVAGGLAGGAVPTVAASIASALNDPAVVMQRGGWTNAKVASDQQIQQMAEDDPIGAQLTFGKDRVTQAMNAPSRKSTVVANDQRVTEGYRAPTTKASTPSPAPAAPAAPATPLTPAERIAAQAKTLKGQGATTSTPVGVEDTPGTTAYYTGGLSSKGPTTTATVPGKGSATFQPGTGTNDASVMLGARTGQISAGARTDAEAARNLQARAEQDQAARFMVDSMNRGAEAERDTRAAKLGVSRGVLDRMEGRDTSAGRASLAAQTAPDTSAPGVWDRSGDSFGDAALREARFNSLLDDAGNQRGLGAKRRAAAKIQSAAAMLQPGMAAVEADTAQRKSAADLQAAQFNSLTDLQKAQMQEAGQNQRAQATNATTLGAAKIAQAGGLAREEMQQKGLDAREGAKLRQANSKEVIDYLTKATFADGKNPPVVTQQDLEATLNELDPAAINAAGGGNAEDIAALRAGRIPDVATAQKLVAIAQQRRQGTPGLWGRMTGNEAPNATDLFLNQAGYMKNWQEKQRAN